MTSQVEVPPLTGLIHFNSGKRRVKLGIAMLMFDLFPVLQKIAYYKWYENSVRFENLMGNGIQKGQISVRFCLTV